MTDLAGHGSMYDSWGRFRQGRALLDLSVPPYALMAHKPTKIG